VLEVKDKEQSVLRARRLLTEAVDAGEALGEQAHE
jgi:hypothetical protein